MELCGYACPFCLLGLPCLWTAPANYMTTTRGMHHERQHFGSGITPTTLHNFSKLKIAQKQWWKGWWEAHLQGCGWFHHFFGGCIFIVDGCCLWLKSHRFKQHSCKPHHLLTTKGCRRRHFATEKVKRRLFHRLGVVLQVSVWAIFELIFHLETLFQKCTDSQCWSSIIDISLRWTAIDSNGHSTTVVKLPLLLMPQLLGELRNTTPFFLGRRGLRRRSYRFGTSRFWCHRVQDRGQGE